MRRLPRRLRAVRGQRGFTLIELLISMVVMVTVVTSLTTLFVSGSRAEVDMNRRFEAQEQARVAIDRLRREVHCADLVTVTSASNITLRLPAHCPTATGGAITNVVWDVQSAGTNRYKLRRGGVAIADYITNTSVFSYTAQSTSTLAKLNVDLRVNRNPNEGWKQWRLRTDIVLRNSLRQ
jgi:prepilin-type N-terminal cleavage/methylation domain-containing protein